MVAAGHTAVPFLRWGDPIMAGAPEWDIENQSAEAQEQQFGYNCDYIAYLPLPQGSDSSDHGLLWVNHEYTNPELMFPGYLSPNPEFDPTEA
ncbi:MAG TPA: alkaline phosphatase PhoX, partial [Thermomicrobiales bacterium]|nr:alkaline phosphatase PhoX [Thermomicrobiales bacterium]